MVDYEIIDTVQVNKLQVGDVFVDNDYCWYIAKVEGVNYSGDIWFACYNDEGQYVTCGYYSFDDKKSVHLTNLKLSFVEK